MLKGLVIVINEGLSLVCERGCWQTVKFLLYMMCVLGWVICVHDPKIPTPDFVRNSEEDCGEKDIEQASMNGDGHKSLYV